MRLTCLSGYLAEEIETGCARRDSPPRRGSPWSRTASICRRRRPPPPGARRRTGPSQLTVPGFSAITARLAFPFWKIEYSRRPERAAAPTRCGSLIRKERLREFGVGVGQQ